MVKSKNRKGWSALEYIIGAVLMVGIITAVVKQFGGKLTEAVDKVEITLPTK